MAKAQTGAENRVHATMKDIPRKCKQKPAGHATASQNSTSGERGRLKATESAKVGYEGAGAHRQSAPFDDS